MKTKYAAFINFVKSSLYLISAITETWFMDAGVINNELVSLLYSVYRRDRHEKSHGGVLIAFNSVF